jgi:hypothetical protein
MNATLAYLCTFLSAEKFYILENQLFGLLINCFALLDFTQLDGHLWSMNWKYVVYIFL